MLMSGVSREGLDAVLRKVRAEIEADRARERAAGAEEEPWRP